MLHGASLRSSWLKLPGRSDSYFHRRGDHERPGAGSRGDLQQRELAIDRHLLVWGMLSRRRTGQAHEIATLEVERHVDEADEHRHLDQGADDGGEGYP